MCRTAHSHVIALVVSHRAGVADDVGGQDRRQFALLMGHGNSPACLQRIVEGAARLGNQVMRRGGGRAIVLIGFAIMLWLVIRE